MAHDDFILLEQQGDEFVIGEIARGDPGPYFTPAVDGSGNISWTNNGNLPNPQTRNIKGPQGEPGIKLYNTQAGLPDAITQPDGTLALVIHHSFWGDYALLEDDGYAWEYKGSLKGKGIDHIAKTGSEGVIDTYTIYFTDGTTWTYQVANSSESSADRIVYHEEDPHPAGYAGNAINDLQIAFQIMLTWLNHKEADWEPRIASLESSRTTDEGRLSTLESTVSNHGTRLTNAEGKVTTLEGKMATTEANITKLTKRTNMVSGTVTLQNTEAFPFNNSQVTVPISVERDNQNYLVDYEVTEATGNVGDIIVSAKLVNGFKIEHTGSATSVTVKYQVLGGMA